MALEWHKTRSAEALELCLAWHRARRQWLLAQSQAFAGAACWGLAILLALLPKIAGGDVRTQAAGLIGFLVAGGGAWVFSMVFWSEGIKSRKMFARIGIDAARRGYLMAEALTGLKNGTEAREEVENDPEPIERELFWGDMLFFAKNEGILPPEEGIRALRWEMGKRGRIEESVVEYFANDEDNE